MRLVQVSAGHEVEYLPEKRVFRSSRPPDTCARTQCRCHGSGYASTLASDARA